MHAHEHGVVGADLALHERHVIDVVDVVLVDDAAELAARARGHRRVGGAPHELLLAQPVVDQVGDA